MSPASRGSSPPRAAVAQAALDVARFVAQPVGAVAADAVAAVEPVDLPLDVVDPDLQVTDHAPVALAVAVVAVVTIGIRRGLRLRIILGGGGAGGDKSRAGGGEERTILRITALLELSG